MALYQKDNVLDQLILRNHKKFQPISMKLKSDKSYTGQISYHYTEKTDLNVVKETIKAGL